MDSVFFGNVVKYNDQVYLHYRNNPIGLAQLIDQKGNKFPGTPSPDKLVVMKSDYFVTEYNGHNYVMTKQGIFSLTSGNKIESSAIFRIFDFEICLMNESKLKTEYSTVWSDLVQSRINKR